MKSKITILFLLISLVAVSQSVPNTTTFSLQDVVNVVNPTTDDLNDCFADANSDYFNDSYSGSKNSLLNFRDYGPHNAGTVVIFTSSGTWTSPSGITEVIVECWGGGGAGGAGGTGTQGGGGGSAGGYFKGRCDIMSNHTYTIVVGTGGIATTGNGGNGTSSSFNFDAGISEDKIMTSGGGGGKDYDNGGDAGSANYFSYYGTMPDADRTSYFGGMGAAGTSSYSGGGGGSSGTTGAGGNASTITGGSGTALYGGGGGNGTNTSNSNGFHGSNYGGGGGGATGTGTAGNGAAGLVRIIY